MNISFFTDNTINLHDSQNRKSYSQDVRNSLRDSGRASAEGISPDSNIPAVARDDDSNLQKPDNEEQNTGKNFDSFECQTCKNRKYQDGSDDPGVSFKTPTKLSPEKAASSVRAHENEHVVREQAEARRTDREVVSQNVSYHSAICPECGRTYISGGTTKTVTKAEVEQTYGLTDKKEEAGRYIDTAV